MEARETPLVVLPSAGVVHTDVLQVFFAQPLDGLLDVSVIEGNRDSLAMEGCCSEDSGIHASICE